MPRICIALLLALGGSASAAVCSMTNGVMDKAQAVQCMGGLKTACPEGTDKKRSPASCGGDACGIYLASAKSSTIDAMGQAFKICSSDAECAPYATMGTDWLKYSVGLAAVECGLEKKTDVIDATVGSCVGSMLWQATEGSYCPQRCEREGDGRRLEDGKKLPKCQPGQDERSPSECGNARCGDYLKSLSDSKIDSLMAGFKKCASEGPKVAPYAAYADYGADYVRFHTLQVAKECGLSSQIPVPAANTCVGGVWAMQGMDIHCPKQCSDDGEDARKCEKGEKERSKSSCGTTACDDFIASIDDAKIDSMMTGMGKCASAGEKSPLLMYGFAAQDDSNYLKYVVKSAATECGASDKLKFTATIPQADTCLGAVTIMSSFDQDCPRQCSLDGSDGYPKCVDQEERTASTCGNTRCGDFLNSFNCHTFETMPTGLLKCKGSKEFEWAVQWTKWDAAYWRTALSGLAYQCGVKLNASVLDASPAACPTTTTTPASSGSSASKTKYAANVEVTMSKAHADALTSNLANAKSIFGKAIAKTANVPINDVTITKIYKDGVEVTQRRLSSSTDTVIKVDWEIVAPSSASPITAASLPAANLKTNVQSAASSASVPVIIVITRTPTVSRITSVAIAAGSATTTKAGAGSTNGCAKWNLWASSITALLAFSTFA